MPQALEIIDKYYPEGELREILLRHSSQVAQKAIAIARAKSIDIPEDDIYTAGMLHDIGIFLTDAAGIHCFGSQPYICHGYLGADLLRKEGVDERFARVAERHTGAGLTHEDIVAANLPIPTDRDYLPETQLERLICFADKFYSKSGDMQEKTIERVRASIAKFGPGAVERFSRLYAEFV